MNNAGPRRMELAGPGRPFDLVAIFLVVAAAALLSMAWPGSALTAALAFIAVYFAPGYAISAAMFPGKRVFSGSGGRSLGPPVTLLERFVMSVMLSLFAVAVEGSIIAGAFFSVVVTDLNSASVIVELALTSFVATAFALYRRSKLPEEDQFSLTLSLPRSFSPLSRAEKVIGAVLVGGSLVAVGLLVSGSATAPPEPYTEFALTDTAGHLSGLPARLNVSENGSLLVNVLNRLNVPVTYNLTIGLEQEGGFTTYHPVDWAHPNPLVNGTALTDSISLGNGGQASKSFIFSIGEPGDHKILFVLSQGSSTKTLWLWVTVTNPA